MSTAALEEMSMLSDMKTDDSYEDWKQIDGIFASMGVNGELSEESLLSFIRKDQKSSLGSWLAGIGLGQYENVLIANGFDNIDMLNGGILEEAELHTMGFTDIDHIHTILLEVKKRPSTISTISGNPPSSVKEWLSSLDLEHYLDKFYSMGYTTMARVQQIWEIELATVLSVVLLGHQKRILVSLGDDRAGFDTLRCKQRSNVSDISQVVRVADVKVDSHQDNFKHNFDDLKPKFISDQIYSTVMKSSSSQKKSSTSPTNISRERSDSGCSIGSDGLETAERSHDLVNPDTVPSPLESPKQTEAQSRYCAQTSSSLPCSAHSDNKINSQGSMASYNRSQSVKQLTKLSNVSTAALDADGSGSNQHADYANIAETGVPLVGNIDGLRLSIAQNIPKKASSLVKRPLPKLPTEEVLTFTVDDLPGDFKGKHKPQILIDGCVNYSSCYLGTCSVKDITGPESTREAIAKMKRATENVKKLPIVTLSISFKGVNFIDSSSKRAICEHEITNIYGAAQDGMMMNYFAYITKDILTQGLYCHVFCVKSEELAREVIMTLGEAFDIAYHAIEKHPSLINPDT